MTVKPFVQKRKITYEALDGKFTLTASSAYQHISFTLSFVTA